MTATYTLHLPAGTSSADGLERSAVVRDGFAWGACLVPMLWFVAHRHWLLGLGALVAVAGLGVGLWLVGVPTATIVWAEIFLHLLIGFEGASLRRWSLDRRGRPVADIVLAPDLVSAETRAFGRRLDAPSVARTDPARTEAMRPGTAFAASGVGPVIGLFPDREGRADREERR